MVSKTECENKIYSVYILSNKGTPVYAGSAANPYRRKLAHEAEGIKEFDKFHIVIDKLTGIEALMCENHTIEKYNLKVTGYNKRFEQIDLYNELKLTNYFDKFKFNEINFSIQLKIPHPMFYCQYHKKEETAVVFSGKAFNIDGLICEAAYNKLRFENNTFICTRCGKKKTGQSLSAERFGYEKGSVICQRCYHIKYYEDKSGFCEATQSIVKGKLNSGKRFGYSGKISHNAYLKLQSRIYKGMTNKQAKLDCGFDLGLDA